MKPFNRLPWVISQDSHHTESWRKFVLPSCCILLLLSIGHQFRTPFPPVQKLNSSIVPISAAELSEGEGRCQNIQIRPVIDYGLASKRLAALSAANTDDTKRTCLLNATLLNGNGLIEEGVDIILSEGIIEQISKTSDLSVKASGYCTWTVDLQGRFVTPGLVHLHTHAGVRQLPQLWASEDVTELSSATTPWARAIDGYKSNDVGIELSAAGGVTTALVLTGAQNIFSGEGFVFKMLRGDVPNASLIDTSTESGGKAQRYMKMALGENIKLTFQKLGGPYTREGIAYFARHILERAQKLMQEQDRWCSAFSTSSSSNAPSIAYPTSLELQNLVDLIRGDIRLNVHCYETEDVFSLFGHSDEFGFNISAVHHALSSHLMLDELKRRGVTVATFSDAFGFKPEIFDTSFYLTKAIADAGIPLALTSDHPAYYGKHLIYQAQVSHHYGVAANTSIASLIGVPAKTLGLDNRVGLVKPGYDADVVVWNKHPLRLGATPLLVILEGKVVENSTDRLWNIEHSTESHTPPPQRQQHEAQPATCQIGQKDLVIQGITSDLYTNANSSDSSHIEASTVKLSATAVIRNGKLECIGTSDCQILGRHLAESKKVPVMQLKDGYVLPGLSMVTRQHGMGEIPYEDSTMDGKNAGNEFSTPVFAKEALRIGGDQHIDRAHRRGITQLITPPLTNGFFHGISAAFRTGASSILDKDAIPVEDCALHFSLGHSAKMPSAPSVSQELQLLREILTTKRHLNPLYEEAAKGEFPVVVHVNNKDIIAHLIKLKRDTGASIIILGGAEAHLLALPLADASIPVLLSPGICIPLTWDERRCLIGPPVTNYSNADILLEAGVKLGLANWDYRQQHVEDSLWEASWTVGAHRPRVALDMLSKNIEEIFGLRREERERDVVVYEGNPFEFGASVAVVLEVGGISRCWPDVEPARGSM